MYLEGNRLKFDFVGALLSIFGWSRHRSRHFAGKSYGFFFIAKQPFTVGSFEIAPFGLSITPILLDLAFACLALV